ncbi:MAG: hypothetical protein JNK82_32960 [Myxococcaceae bacterium]|nr:hypothetical protein [Myxococcaceae bacterium]
MTTLVLIAALGGIELRGLTTCPTVEQVEAQLQVLGPQGEGRVELEDRGLELRLTWRSAGGEARATRALPLPASCEALARASAVTIATWALEPAPKPRKIEPDAPLTPLEPTRVFSVSVLREAKLNLELAPARPEPPRIRGPIGLIVLGSVLHTAGIASAIALGAGRGLDTAALGTAAFIGVMAGRVMNLTGVIWLMQCFGQNTPPQR